MRNLLIALNALPVPFGLLTLRHLRGRRRADADWSRTKLSPVADVGEVERLRILPIVDALSDDPQLATEPGVSYLVEADGYRVLFDVGFNRNGERPSPFARNLARLAPDVRSVDALVISHAHLDHVGTGATPRLRGEVQVDGPLDLERSLLVFPEPLRLAGRPGVVAEGPLRLRPGLWTTGGIARHLYFLGMVREQALAVRVRGRGLVLVVGCGHQGVPRLLEAALTRFGGPLHGIVGGLHFPLTDSRMKGPLGFPFQMVVGTGQFPWRGVTERDVRDAIGQLAAQRPALVALSPHDSCDGALARFREAFGAAYRPVLVGKPIEVAADTPCP